MLPSSCAQLLVTTHMRHEIEYFHPLYAQSYENAVQENRLIEVSVEATCEIFAKYAGMKCFGLGQVAAITYAIRNKVKIFTVDKMALKILNDLCSELICITPPIQFDVATQIAVEESVA